MSALETDLAALLTAYGENAPDDLGLLSRVQARSAQRTRRRRVGLAVATAVSVAAVAVVATNLPGGRDRSDRFTDPTGFLVDGRGLELRLPFTPTYLPGTLRPTPVSIEQLGGLTRAQWLFQADSTVPTQLFIAINEPVVDTRGATTEDVGGVPASVSCRDSSTCDVRWLRAPEQRVDVNVLRLDGTARVEALRVARGLAETDLVVRPPIQLGLVPSHGCVLNTPHGDVSMNPTERLTSPCPLGVHVGTVGQDGVQDGQGDRVRLGGYDGWLAQPAVAVPAAPGDLPSYQAVLKLDGDKRLVVMTPRVNGWNRKALDRFVRAIELHPKAPADPFTDPSGFLVDSRDQVLSFPLTPTYPLTLSARVSLQRAPDGGQASFVYRLPTDGSAAATVTVTAARPAVLVLGAEKVDGEPAQVTCRSHTECSVVWRRPAGEYVTVLLERTGGQDRPDLLRVEALKVARGLTATPLVQRPTVVLGLLPPSCRIGSINDDPVSDTMSVVATGPDPDHLCSLSVSLGKSTEPAGFAFRDATVGGRRVRLAETAQGGTSGLLLAVPLPDGRTLGLQVPQGNGWTRTELDRFVAAVVLP